jgi:hypothetical protein
MSVLSSLTPPELRLGGFSYDLNFRPLKNTIRLTVVFIVTIATSQYCIHSGITSSSCSGHEGQRKPL